MLYSWTKALSKHLAFHLLDSVLSRGVRTQSHHTPCKLCFEFEVHLDQLFARQGCWGQRSKTLLVFLDEPTETRVKVHALQFLRKIPLSVEVPLPFFQFLYTPHSFKGQFILPVLATLFGQSEESIPGVPQYRGESLLHHHPRTI